jgi:hypothetical protein
MPVCCGEDRSTGFCPTCGKNLADNQFIGLTERNLRHILDDAVHNLRWAESSVRDAKKQVDRLRQDVLIPAEQRHEQAAKKLQNVNDAIRYAREHGLE